MLYAEYISKARQICIYIDSDMGCAYLEPDYKYLLHLSNLKIEDIEDYDGVTPEIISEDLKLTVDKYNVLHNQTPVMSEYIMKNLIPALSDMRSMTELQAVENYIKQQDETKKALKQQDLKIKNILDSGFSFNKVDVESLEK